jgi:MFS family permease
MKIQLAASSPRYRWVILLIATLAQACACFFVQGLGAIAPYIQQDLQLSSAQIGALVSAAQLVPLVGLLVAGELLDRYSERKVVGIGTLLVGAALLAAVQADGYQTVLLFLLVVGAGYSTAQPGGSKSVARWFAPQQRGFAMGIRQAGLPLGGALAALLLPAAAALWGWRSSFLLGGAMALVGAVLFISFYRSPPQPAAVAATTPQPTAGLAELLCSRLRMLREPALKRIAISGVSLIAVQYGILIFTVLDLHQRLQLEVGRAAGLLFVAQAAGVAGRIVLASWSDHSKAGRYFPVLVCLAACLLGLLWLIWLPLNAMPALVLLMGWLGFFGFGWYGPWVAYVAEAAPPDKTGFMLGLAMAINQLAIVLLPPALGWLHDASHSFVPGWTVLLLLTAAALLATRRTGAERWPAAPGA